MKTCPTCGDAGEYANPIACEQDRRKVTADVLEKEARQAVDLMRIALRQSRRHPLRMVEVTGEAFEDTMYEPLRRYFAQGVYKHRRKGL